MPLLTTQTEEKYIVQYKPRENFPWMVSGSFYNPHNAGKYLDHHRATRPNVFAWRLVHRVTVTTVTEEVVG
jgi:hypothetical protein